MLYFFYVSVPHEKVVKDATLQVEERTIANRRDNASPLQKRWYVYTLSKQTGEVFYVGMVTGNRLDLHEWEARSGIQSRKCNVIRGIWAQGQQIVKKIIYETDVKEDAKQCEQDCIQFEYAGPCITNVVGNMYELTRRREERFQENRRLTQRLIKKERRATDDNTRQ